MQTDAVSPVDHLVAMGACHEAIEWIKAYDTMAAAWRECLRADWMLWYARRIYGAITPTLRLAMCACARTALQYVPRGEDQPRLAIETAERYARGETTTDDLRFAANAADVYAAYAAAANDAAVYAAIYAADAAASAAAADAAADAAAAAAAVYAVYAAYAAAAAAADVYAAVYAAGHTARTDALAVMADLVREIIPACPNTEAV